MKTLLVSVDFSAATRAVLDTAVELLAGRDSRLVLHHSYLPPVVSTEFGLGVEMLQEAFELGLKNARHQLQHLEDELTAQGHDVASVLTEGAAAPHILELSRKHHADVIVLGSHGHTAFYELLVGSTTHTVLKKAACAVLIVPPGKAAAKGKARAKPAKK